MIETTGLADPAPVVQSFFIDEAIKSQYQLNGVVTVVDAKHIFQQLGQSPEAKEQIAFADMVLLNKTDLINPEDLPELEYKIRNINSAARICQTRNSDVDIGMVLDLRSLDLEVKAEHHDPHHKHTEDIETVAIATPGDLDGVKISQLVPRADRGIRRAHHAHEGNLEPAQGPRPICLPGSPYAFRGPTGPGLGRIRKSG